MDKFVLGGDKLVMNLVRLLVVLGEMELIIPKSKVRPKAIEEGEEAIHVAVSLEETGHGYTEYQTEKNCNIDP